LALLIELACHLLDWRGLVKSDHIGPHYTRPEGDQGAAHWGLGPMAMHLASKGRPDHHQGDVAMRPAAAWGAAY
jgi:hypothetical protein